MRPIGWHLPHAPRKWDYRVEYIQSSGASYFDLKKFFNDNWGDGYGETEVWRLQIGVNPVPAGDKKMFGAPYAFGMAAWFGTYRPSYFQNWPNNLSIRISDYPIINYEVDTVLARIYSLEGNLLFSAKKNSKYRFVDLTQAFCVGCMSQGINNAMYPVSNHCTHQIYSFSREKNGKKAFDFIPCVKDGVVGMYEDVSGVFFPSQTSSSFVAGPKI